MEKAGILRSITAHIKNLVEKGEVFSDLQIEENQPLVWRRPSGWEETGFGQVAIEDMMPLLKLINPNWKQIIREKDSLDCTIDLNGTRFRCNVYSTNARSRTAATIRKLGPEPPTIASLGLPAQVGMFAAMPKGLLLVAGATGSGKTATIASLIRQINETRSAHIITIEEPIEYLFERNKSIITQREVGVDGDVSSFAAGLKDALRQRPDVIVVGEILDAETAATALRAAESGHYVMASLHARNAIGAITKMLSFFPNETQTKAIALANSLCGVLAQSLVATNDERSIPAVELLPNNNSEVSSMIADVGKHRQLEEALRSDRIRGAIYMNTVLRKLVTDNKISRKTAISASYCPDELGF